MELRIFFLCVFFMAAVNSSLCLLGIVLRFPQILQIWMLFGVVTISCKGRQTKLETQNFIAQGSPKQIRTKYNYKRANYLAISNLFQALNDFFDKQNLSNANDMWTLFTKLINDSLNRYVPTMLARPRGHPWMTRPLLRLIRKRQRVYLRS